MNLLRKHLTRGIHCANSSKIAVISRRFSSVIYILLMTTILCHFSTAKRKNSWTYPGLKCPGRGCPTWTLNYCAQPYCAQFFCAQIYCAQFYCAHNYCALYFLCTDLLCTYLLCTTLLCCYVSNSGFPSISSWSEIELFTHSRDRRRILKSPFLV